MNRYFISGMPSDLKSGTGVFLRYLEKEAVRKQYVLISRNKLYFNKFAKLSFCNTDELKDIHDYFFNSMLLSIKDSEVILFHPQTIGWDIFLKIIENNTIVKFYVLDNSFFCIKSYNHMDESLSGCLKCLGNAGNCEDKCSAFPVKYNKQDNIDYLEKLRSLSGKIIFYAQNDRQKDLLVRHFGSTIKVSSVGLIADDFFEKGVVAKKKYDIVYHGNSLPAKGSLYVIQLAKKLRNYTILFPESKSSILKYCDHIDIPDNIVFKQMTWESGLKNEICSCGLVLCPSLWSAPIEGALIKSLLFNGNVAVVNTDYSFASQIPDDTVLKLNENIDQSAEKIHKFFMDKHDFSKTSKKWVDQFLAENNPNQIFSTSLNIESSSDEIDTQLSSYQQFINTITLISNQIDSDILKSKEYRLGKLLLSPLHQIKKKVIRK